MALPDEPRKTSTDLPPLGRQSDSQLIENFKQDPTGFAKKIIKETQQLNRFWQALESRFSSDPNLVRAYDKTQNILGKMPAAAAPQPQVIPPAAPPVLTAEQLTGQEAATPKNQIGPDNAKPIEDWLNNVKHSIGDLYSQEGYSAQRAGYYSRAFSAHLLSYLSLYRGELAKFYLDEGVHELLFSALGPIGNAMRVANAKNISLKMAWMKNPLNPMAIYYYMNSLPTQKAFELMYLPAKAVFGILAKGGAPLISKVYTPHYKNDNQTGLVKIDEQLVFTPLLRSTQALDKLADTIDAKAGRTSDYFQLKNFTENTNLEFTQALNELKKAQTMGSPSRVFGARQKLNNLLNKYHQGIFQKILANTARRLRPNPHHPKDPFSFIFSLLGGAIWDATVGLALNFARVAANKALSFIPGYQILRAQITKFFTSNNVLNTFSASGRTLSSFARGTFSPTTFSHGYLGYKFGSSLFPNLAATINLPFLGNIVVHPIGFIAGATSTAWGAYYTTALKMAANPYYFNAAGDGWVQIYKKAYAFGDTATLKSQYLSSFQPKTLSRFADFLHRNWAVRIPINGLVAADFLAPLMERLYGWDLWTTRAVFMGADYLWQIKGPLLRSIGTFISELPVVQRLVTSIQFGITFPVQNWWFNMVYKATSFQQSLVGAVPTAWKMRTWARFGQNFFNPGFFMGFSLVPLLTPTMGAWAYVVAPVGGSVAWFAATNLAASIAGMSPEVFMARLNPLVWTGYIVGSIAQMVFPALPWWFSMASGVGFGIFGMGLNITFSAIASALGTTVSALVSGLTGLTASTIAASMAAWATITSVALVAGLTVFFAYTTYAGFWVPMIEEGTAKPQSSNFYVNNSCTKTAANQYYCCSNVSVSENIFNAQQHLDHKTDFSNTDLSIDLSTQENVENNTDAWFNSQGLNYDPAGDAVIFLKLPFYAVNTLIPIVNGQGAGQAAVLTYLPTPSDQAQNLFELMSKNSSVVRSMKPFWDILVALAEEKQACSQAQQGGPGSGGGCNQSALIQEYKDQLALLNAQKELVKNLINPIKSGNLERAKQIAETALAKFPDNNSWEIIVNGYINNINRLLGATDPDTETYAAELEAEQETITSQIEIINQIIEMAEKVKSMMSEAKAAEILKYKTQYTNFTNLPEADQTAIWSLLVEFFPDIFTDKKFYFIPKGTNYRACLNLTYSGPIPGTEQTVCSTISYQPSIWGPNTSFAKSCTTFTPQ